MSLCWLYVHVSQKKLFMLKLLVIVNLSSCLRVENWSCSSVLRTIISQFFFYVEEAKNWPSWYYACFPCPYPHPRSPCHPNQLSHFPDKHSKANYNEMHEKHSISSGVVRSFHGHQGNPRTNDNFYFSYKQPLVSRYGHSY